jgi:hypothetical protein
MFAAPIFEVSSYLVATPQLWDLVSIKPAFFDIVPPKSHFKKPLIHG